MNMTELLALLQSLRIDVASARFADPQARERLSAMLAEIEKQLMDTGAGAGIPPEGLVDGLRTAVDQFEVEHPRFAGLLNQLVNALSAMGI